MWHWCVRMMWRCDEMKLDRRGRHGATLAGVFRGDSYPWFQGILCPLFNVNPFSWNKAYSIIRTWHHDQKNYRSGGVLLITDGVGCQNCLRQLMGIDHQQPFISLSLWAHRERTLMVGWPGGLVFRSVDGQTDRLGSFQIWCLHQWGEGGHGKAVVLREVAWIL